MKCRLGAVPREALLTRTLTRLGSLAAWSGFLELWDRFWDASEMRRFLDRSLAGQKSIKIGHWSVRGRIFRPGRDCRPGRLQHGDSSGLPGRRPSIKENRRFNEQKQRCGRSDTPWAKGPANCLPFFSSKIRNSIIPVRTRQDFRFVELCFLLSRRVGSGRVSWSPFSMEPLMFS